ncbi:MAG: hypothetical protein IT490_14945 [Candidatus Contendobacter sp.]|nr:hypothetical protein [Candidatus Contendobacter sp.]
MTNLSVRLGKINYTPNYARPKPRLKILLTHNDYGSAAPSGENQVFEAERALLQQRGHSVSEIIGPFILCLLTIYRKTNGLLSPFTSPTRRNGQLTLSRE